MSRKGNNTSHQTLTNGARSEEWKIILLWVLYTKKVTNCDSKICSNPFPAAFGLLPFPDFFRKLTSASRALLALVMVNSSSRMVENPAFFPANTSQDLVEWFSVWTVWIRLPLLYVSQIKMFQKPEKFLFRLDFNGFLLGLYKLALLKPCLQDT